MVDKSNRNEAHFDKWRLSAWISNSSAKQTPMMTWTLMAHLTIVYSTHFSMWLMCAYDVRMRRLSSQSGNCYNDRCWYNINASNKCSSFYFLGFSFHLVNTFFSLYFLNTCFIWLAGVVQNATYNYWNRRLHGVTHKHTVITMLCCFLCINENTALLPISHLFRFCLFCRFVVGQISFLMIIETVHKLNR